MPESVIRLYYGRDSHEMVGRLKEYQASDVDEPISALEVRETVLDDDVVEAIVDLLQARRVNMVQLDDCGAYMNHQALRMARALGAVENVRITEPTFLSHYFLESLLSSATTLTYLRIQDRFDCRQAKSLAKGMKQNKSVEILDLSRSRLDSFQILSEGLYSNTRLKELKLRSLGLNDENIGCLLDAARGHPSLQILDLSFNNLRSPDNLTTLLVHPECRLKELALGYQNLWQSSKCDISRLSRALRRNKSVKSLLLARNKLNDSDILLLATMLTCNSSLRSLDMRENEFSDDGIKILAGTLKAPNCIRSLKIANNPFQDAGSAALLELVETNRNICHVQLHSSARRYRDIQLSAALNRGGRGFLFNSSPELALWPKILERINRMEHDYHHLDVLFFMVRWPILYEGRVS